MRHIRNEQIRAETAAILRFARVAELKRRALSGLVDLPLGKARSQHIEIAKNIDRRRPRPLFILPRNARLRRLLLSCCIKRA
jgi:hypothetical protein